MLTRVWSDASGRDWLLVVEGEKWARAKAGGRLNRHWLEGIAEGLHILGELSEVNFFAAIAYAMSADYGGVQ